ncbi:MULTISPECIES: hypothetical protein [Streptomyces]|uniref:Secreted protein n=1 Tax=Streptomyces hydrogenans TaxID=1873719 RepID=A0ABQ3P2D7_9ACTN|nr:MULTISPECIES: hypothetical protein [Streptomyces]MCM1944167.1 hypothetical protein [Streptomyces sp. G2]GHG25814.1 hypothetical protein GCM10018784_44120 [Streptomyces hydrogenans]GHI19178.1 hypothetical protein Shyd_05490 [Streptomyces hydrogenans]GHJ94881.1 hypothetical protein SNE510_44000 [Streptomyces sp. NE5-10]
MKPTKVAAVVAGSLMALGVAAPAMAQQALTPTSLNGGLEAIAANGLKSDVLSSTTEGSPVKSVTDTATQLNQTGKGLPLVGGLPVNPLGG